MKLEIWSTSSIIYHWRTIFSPSAIGDFVRDTNILMEALPRYRKTFSLLTFTWIVFFSLFLSFIQEKNIVINLVNPNTTVHSPFFFFVVEVLYLAKTLYLRGKASQLAVLTFNNSPITHLVVLKCGLARELVTSVTLNSIGKPQPTSVPCVDW